MNNIWYEVLSNSKPFHFDVIEAYLGLSTTLSLHGDVKKAMESFDGEDPELFLYSLCTPGPLGDKQQRVLPREKKLINKFWKLQTPPDLSECSVNALRNSIKLFCKGDKTKAIAFGNPKSGQFGEFISPLIIYEDFVMVYNYLHPDREKKTITPNDIYEFSREMNDISMDYPIILPTEKGYVELKPLNLFGVKLIPISKIESNTLRANNGSFSAEVIANLNYEKLARDSITFTPLFSKDAKIEFNIDMFSSNNILVLNKLQSNLHKINTELAKLKKYDENPVSWNIVNEEKLKSVLFTNKIGFFTTTNVGKSINDTPSLERDELVALIVDALWLTEQTLLNKIYLTDLNIGNILYYDMKHIAAMSGYYGETYREYVWGGAYPKSLRIKNFYTRLTFVDLGTSFIENPEMEYSKVIDESFPMTKSRRIELREGCRDEIIAALQLCCIASGNDEEISKALTELDIEKNIFTQFIETDLVKEYTTTEDRIISERYVSKNIR